MNQPSSKGNEPVHTLDLSGRTCPESFVEAKLALEKLETGERMLVIVGDEESARRIPENMENHGQEMIHREKDGDIWKIVIERCSSADRNRWIVMD